MNNSKKTILLLHGAWEGAWAWGDTQPLLEAKGHKVHSFDLPGHGEDKTPISEITLQVYADAVRKEIDKIGEPVVLVGHSFAGYIIARAAENNSENIEKVVFVASAVPYDGKTAAQIFEEDEGSELMKSLIISEDKSYATISRENVRDVIVTTATEDQIDMIMPLLVPQAVNPFYEPVVTGENFAKVPKAYIETKKDRVISLKAQRLVQKEAGISEALTLDDGHVPLLTQPNELAEALAKVAVSSN